MFSPVKAKCILIVGLLWTFTVSILIGFLPFDGGNSKCKEESSSFSSYFPEDKHNLAILVPFRAFLLNVGFLEVAREFDYIALHDVDLIPINLDIDYVFPEDGPYHVSAPYLHPRYHYPTFIGGILLLKTSHFEQINGMSNKYWGWGLEDDEFFARLKEAKLTISRPGNLSSGKKNTFKHLHDSKTIKRDSVQCYNQAHITRYRDRETGLNTAKYNIISKRRLKIEDVPVTVINVELLCNKSLTPWCDCTKNIGNTKVKETARHSLIIPKLNRSVHITFDG